MITEPILFIFLHMLPVNTHQKRTELLGDFFVFYIKNVRQKNICLNQKIIRAFVDTHMIHIPNMHRATFYHVVYF